MAINALKSPILYVSRTKVKANVSKLLILSKLFELNLNNMPLAKAIIKNKSPMACKSSESRQWYLTQA